MNTTTTNENWFDINYIEGNAYYTHFIPLLNNKRVAIIARNNFIVLCRILVFQKHFVIHSFLILAAGFRYVLSAKIILDIDCGNGILMKQLANTGRFDKVIGCDWNTCPGWNEVIQQYGDKILFYVVNDDEFSSFVKTHHPGAFVLILVLHHMELPTQYKYIKNLFDTMSTGARLIIVEEGIPTTLLPKMGQDENDQFMKFSHQERQDVLTIYDRVANIFLERRAMPIPSTNRTMEEWESFFEEIGFDILSKQYVGWSVRNVINPQPLFVLEKPLYEK